MALFERDDPSLAGVDGESPQLPFPTEPAFVVPVIVKETPRYGEGHKGVFALAKIPSGTKFWIWTDRITSIHHSELEEYIKTSVQEVEVFLRQGFVLPDKPDYFHSNPTDAGRFINHSAQPNCGPDGTLRDIFPGEELTMDYSFHGNPDWYQAICRKYGVLTEAQVAAAAEQNSVVNSSQ